MSKVTANQTGCSDISGSLCVSGMGLVAGDFVEDFITKQTQLLYFDCNFVIGGKVLIS